jgi:hypothetical protein
MSQPTPIKNLTRKSMEEATLKILRQNKTASLGYVPNNMGDKVSKKHVSGVYIKRNRELNEAHAINHVEVTRKGPYRTGDGDFPTAMRPGCDDHKKFKSLISGGEVSYPRSHK